MSPQRLLHLLHYALGYRPQWMLIVFCTLLGSLMTLLHPWPMKLLVDNVLQHEELPRALRLILAPLSGTPAALLGCVVAAGLLIFFINSISDVLLTRAWVRVGQGMVWRLAADLYARLQRRSILFHSRNRVGDCMSRIAGDSWSVHTLVDRLIFAPATALVMLTMVLIVMFRMDVAMTLLALGVAPLMTAGAWLLAGPVGALAKARRELDTQMQSHLQQTLAGIGVVQAFTQEGREQQRFRSIARSAMQMHHRAALLSGANDLISGLITTIGAGAVLLVGGQRVLRGELTVGSLLVFLGYLVTLQTQMRILASIYPALHELRASVERVMQILEVEPEVQDRPNAVPVPRTRGHVRINDVTFGYAPGCAVLKGISLEVHSGETVAIVGPTGAGKSTLVNLIPRLFDPWQGTVSIDGIDVRNMRLADLRRQVGFVPQETMLFPITIAGNIAYGRPDATREQIVAAAKAANLHEFVQSLEEGYDTVLGQRGATLSGGERQRLAIARALLLDPTILILDEPTSNLDATGEQLIVEAIERLMAGRTTFVIAHRLSTVRDADRVFVLDQGMITQSGTHQSLLMQEGVYARLHQLRSSQRDGEILVAAEVRT